jgi:hypothetical protein
MIRQISRVLLLGAMLPLFVSAHSLAQAQPSPGTETSLRIEVASGRPDTITGGSALIRIHLPESVTPGSLQVELRAAEGTRDISAVFQAESGQDNQTRSVVGLLTAIPLGRSSLSARTTNGAGYEVELALRNHPSHGPVFSGPQQQPFFCNPGESGLGPDHDEFCHTDTVVEYFYRSPTGFVPLADPSVIPDDVLMTTTSTGLEVPLIVRNERGTLNRGIYSIAVLHDPAQPAWGDPLAPQSQWNGRLFYQLEGACRPGYSQDRERAQDILGGLQPTIIGAGYAVARHSFTRHGNTCGNDVLSTESMMMVREHFTVSHGEPLFMVGNGGSGGAIMQYLAADNYPGILDGLITGFTFPDAYSIASGSGDAALLNRAFAESGQWDYNSQTAALFPDSWTAELEEAVKPLTAVSGFGSWALNMTWVTGNARNLDPSIYVGRFVPEDQLYDRERRPDGIRATIYEAGRNSWGVDPATGFARRPLDNTGVQYGLLALNDGTISAEQFVSLNETIGGFDIDGRYIPQRMDIDPELAALAYRTGRVLHGGGGMAEVPILAVGIYQDTVETGADYHDRFRDFSIRARLLKANGHFDNHVMWHTHPTTLSVAFLDLPRLQVMDEWVTAIISDNREIPRSQKVVENRPETLTDRCVFPGGDYNNLQWPADDLNNPCIRELPPAGDPRIAAGGPLSNDIIKCQLTPLDRSTYRVEFSDAQWQRLQAVFAGGVCDWSRPGIGQEGPPEPWLQYSTPGQPRPLADLP